MPDAASPVPKNVLVPAGEVAQAVASAYHLDQILSCTFIRRGFNDHYLVTTAPERYVCRVYLHGKYYIRDADDFKFELALLAHLRGAGVLVSAPVRRRDSELLGWVGTPTGERACALFPYAEGREVEGQVDEQQAEHLGVIVAQFHRAADGFRSPHRRYRLGPEYLVEQPAALIARVGSDNQRAWAAGFPPAAELAATIRALPTEGEGYGIIHGDLHLGNMRFTDDGDVTLYDFDHCAYGWRAYDLASLRTSVPDEEAWAAVLRGYEAVRPLEDWERASIPTFVQARWLWDLGDALAVKPLWDAGGVSVG